MVQLFYCIFSGSEIFEQFLDLLEVVGAREVVDFTGLADFDFDDVLIDGLRANRHADRVADEVAVLELDAGALLAVVEQDVEAGLAALVVDALGIRQLLFLLGVDGDDDDLERCDGARPDDALVIVVLLDGGGHRAADADAVAAHDERLLFTVLIEERRAHGLAVLRAEREDLAGLDAARHLERCAAVRARVALFDHAQVGDDDGILIEVALRIDVLVMDVDFIGTRDGVVHVHDGRIDEHVRALLDADGAHEARAAASSADG